MKDFFWVFMKAVFRFLSILWGAWCLSIAMANIGWDPKVEFIWNLLSLMFVFIAFCWFLDFLKEENKRKK